MVENLEVVVIIYIGEEYFEVFGGLIEIIVDVKVGIAYKGCLVFCVLNVDE